ncbi:MULTISPECIES: hypothetical protein [Salinibaculum]|uniref:hypothetical protein n=1 Tax=Salinibaculum TaxID=2732368 RepID=UPI0030CFFBD5
MGEGTPDGSAGERRVGLICNADHDIFADVARRLEAAGITVTFFEPGRRLTDADLADLALLMNKKVDPESFHALLAAQRLGVPTWNGFRTLLLGVRLLGYQKLRDVGFRVPPTHLTRPDGQHVAKTHVDWHFRPDPELNGEGDVYQELVPATPVDYKYYAVDTGSDIVVQVLKTTSKLRGEKRPLGLVEPDPDLARQVRALLRRTGTQALGVDCVRADGQYWAVDVNPAMSFRNAAMVPDLVESVLARLPGGTDSVDAAETDVRAVEQ